MFSTLFFVFLAPSTPRESQGGFIDDLSTTTTVNDSNDSYNQTINDKDPSESTSESIHDTNATTLQNPQHKSLESGHSSYGNFKQQMANEWRQIFKEFAIYCIFLGVCGIIGYYHGKAQPNTVAETYLYCCWVILFGIWTINFYFIDPNDKYLQYYNTAAYGCLCCSAGIVIAKSIYRNF